MMKTPKPATEETQRLQTLNALKILDSPREERFDRIIRLAQRLLDVPVALFSLVDENRIWCKSRQSFASLETSRAAALCDDALLFETVFVVEDATQDDRFRNNPVFTDGPVVRFYAGCPVSAQDGSPLGTLCVLDTEPRKTTPEDIESLLDLGEIIEGELSSLTMATTDELTKLANRRGFLMIAEPMIALCQRAWHPAAAMTFDLDGLKQINDEFGHEAGDLAIKNFARLLLKAFRDSDVVARVGGDEFCVLLTDPAEADPAVPLDRLQQRVDSHNAEAQRPCKLRFSAGSAQFNKNRHTSLNDLLRDADECMYSQKRAKRCAG